MSAPPVEPPFDVDARVEEEDTYLSLSAAAVLRFPGEHPARVMTGAHDALESAPGSLVVRRHAGGKLTFLAVVHKLDERPSWREGWVASALEALAREGDRYRLAAIALPLLGTVHGRLDAGRSSELTVQALERVPTLERVWLVENERTGRTKR